jgi:acetyl-CoA acetyltransferase
LAAGIPNYVPISTVNRLCSSGLMAIRNIAHAIQAGETSIGLAVGVDSMSKQFSLCFYNCDRVFIR